MNAYKFFMRMFFVLVSVSLFLIYVPSICFSELLYVRPAGGDYVQEDGSDFNNAFDGWSDIQWGEGVGKVGAGDTLYVCGNFVGEYVNIQDSGTATARITMSGDYPDSPGIVNANLARSKAIRIDGVKYVTIENLKVTGASGSGIGSVNVCEGVLISNVKSYGNSGNGFSLSGDNLIIENSESYNNSISGIFISDGSNMSIKNCYVHDNGTDGANADGIFAGNNAINFVVEDCIVSSQKGQTSYDTSSGVGDCLSGASGIFRKCGAYDGPSQGFKSVVDCGDNEVIFEDCLAVNHEINFVVGGSDGVTVRFQNCTAYNENLDVAWAIWGSGERNVFIDNCVAYAFMSNWVIKVPDVLGLELLETNSCLFGGNSIAKIGSNSVDLDTWKEFCSSEGDFFGEPTFSDVGQGNYIILAGTECEGKGIRVLPVGLIAKDVVSPPKGVRIVD